MIMIEITEDKIRTISEYAEKMLRYGGKLMTAIEELEGRDRGFRDEDGMRGYRDEESYRGYRGNYGGRYR